MCALEGELSRIFSMRVGWRSADGGGRRGAERGRASVTGVCGVFELYACVLDLKEGNLLDDKIIHDD